MERVQKEAILRDLNKKMVLLAGPRQAGKTTLAKEIASQFSNYIYLNYDNLADRKIMLNYAWLPSVELIIFDEIHKMPESKNYLKGVYDKKQLHQKILGIGNACLEGNLPVGRCFLHRLTPLSVAECKQVGVPYSLDRFLERGGFPEPFLTSESQDADQWRLHYVDTLLREDVVEFDKIQNFKAIRHVFELLRHRVGSPVSYTSIAEDVQIAPNTVKKYIQILEALYIVFRVSPFSKNIARSLVKEPKIYFFDTGLVKGDQGARFENFVGTCLLKHVFAKVDYEAKNYALHYLQTKEGHEVDFALVHDEAVERLIEVKYANHSIGKGLRYFHTKYGLPAWQVVKELKRERLQEGTQVVEGDSFLQTLS